MWGVEVLGSLGEAVGGSALGPVVGADVGVVMVGAACVLAPALVGGVWVPWSVGVARRL